ncbi:MAG: hypothetical protein WAV25_00215 [Minisyncoccia bacterium]
MNEMPSEAPIVGEPATPDNSLEIYKLKTEISALNQAVQKGTYMPSGFAESKVLENEAKIRELEKAGSAQELPATETTITPIEDSEAERLKKEIDWLNKSVQHGTDLNHDDIEKKVLANEARIRELEGGTVVAAEAPSPVAPEPSPSEPEASPVTIAPTEVVPPTPSAPAVEAVPPTTPKVEAIPVVPIAPETTPSTPTTSEASTVVGTRFSPDNQSRFSKLTEGARNIVSKLYEGIKNIPIVQETVGKMQIAYNQINANEYEHGMVILKRRADGFNARVEAIDVFQTKMRTLIEDLKKGGLPGGESLEEKIRESEENKNKLLKKRDKNQSMFEVRDNKRKVHLEKRDMVAGKLINVFETKLAPIEKDLEIAHGKLDQIDLDMAVAEAKHKNKLEELEGLDKTKTQIEETLRAQGESEKNIKKFEAVKQLGEMIAAEKKAMNDERENLQKTRIKVLEKITKIDEKANPLRDKRGDYVRIKNTRGANLNVDARTKEVDQKASETTSGHPRVDSEPSEAELVESTISTENKEGKKETQEFVSLWNESVMENGGDQAKQIDLIKFTKETRFLSNEKMDVENFKNILARYYKKNKIPLNTFIQDMKKFEEKLINK